jgi:hypothetical protein
MRLNNNLGCYLHCKSLGTIYEQVQEGVKSASYNNFTIGSTYYDPRYLPNSNWFDSDHYEILI